MDKLKMESRPMDNVLKKIAELCPAAVQGDKIDFERLKEELAPDLVDGNESYNFTWIGKRDAIMGAASPIRKTLRPCMAESKNWDTTKNLYIEGDNLDVLKLLQESYLGKVKMIYIDPPYNTGNDFVYCDDFSMCQKDYMEQKGQCDIDTNERLFKNDESNGRYHSNWCSMIYPRLKVARDLLSDDGVIFISIDDNEQANLKKICDEVFGESNFVECFTWESIFRPSNMSKLVRKNAEYILMYAKNLDNIPELVERLQDPQGEASLTQNNNSVRKLSFPKSYVKSNLPDGMYPAGNIGDVILHDNLNIQGGIIVNEFTISGKFKWSQEYLDNEIKNGVFLCIKTATFIPYYKKIYQQTSLRPTKIIPTDLVGDVLSANAELGNYFVNRVFDYPKPISLLKFILNLLPNTTDALIMDFFSGASTTADAVIRLNATDGGNRRFIMIQLPENLDKNKRTATSATVDTINNAIALCDELGVEHKLTEVAKERIRRAGDKIVADTGKTDLDIGFKVLKLDDTNMKDVYYNPANTTQTGLLDNVDNIKSDRTPLDLLYGVMIDLGLTLDLDVRDIKSGNITYFNVDNASLVACFEQNIPESVIKEIANIKPLRVVFRDLCFADAPGKINVTEIFKTISPNTKITVL